MAPIAASSARRSFPGASGHTHSSSGFAADARLRRPPPCLFLHAPTNQQLAVLLLGNAGPASGPFSANKSVFFIASVPRKHNTILKFFPKFKCRQAYVWNAGGYVRTVSAAYGWAERGWDDGRNPGLSGTAADPNRYSQIPAEGDRPKHLRNYLKLRRR